MADQLDQLRELQNEAQCSGDSISTLNGMLEAAENERDRLRAVLARIEQLALTAESGDPPLDLAELSRFIWESRG